LNGTFRYVILVLRFDVFFKRKVSPEEKAELVTAYLPSFPTIGAGKLADLPNFRGDCEGDMELLLELFAFYMHLANRLAFRELGEEECSRFSHRLIVSVANRISTTLNKDYSSVQVIAELRDKYNQREDYYANFKKFVPDGNEPQKGTLFWEFAYVILNQCMESPSRNDLVNVVNILAPEFAEFAEETNKMLRA
jgi:hypothetical protein